MSTIQTLKTNYEAGKRFFFSELYDSSEGFKGTMRSQIAKRVWEDFNKMLIKKEFNFAFLDIMDKKEFDLAFISIMKKKY